MLALAIDEASVRHFMNRLLRGDIFDMFEIRQVELSARTRVSIYGEAEQPAREEAGGYITWAELKPMLTEIIKFGGKPKHLKIVFSMGGEDAKAVHGNAKALFLNLIYENNGVNFTTASSQKEFALDKTLDIAWDNYILDFLTKNKVSASTRL